LSFLGMPAGAKYVRRTIYLRPQLEYRLRSLAVRESWQLADLARTMIIVGLTVRELQKSLEEIGSEHKLVIAMKELTRVTRSSATHPYSFRGVNRRGVWITVHLPAGFLAHVVTYARVKGYSQNDALSMFLRDGMLCYLTGYNRFLRALVEVEPTQSRGKVTMQ